MKKALFLFCVLGVLGFSFIHMTNSADAASIDVHNYSSKESYTYNGVAVLYVVNGQKMTSDYPGMIASDGSALGPCLEIFEEALDVDFTWLEENKSFRLTYGDITIRMTLQSRYGYVNEKVILLPCAPLLLSLSNSKEQRVYVPTRFVSEQFGFAYEWNASKSTSTITKKAEIYDGRDSVSYQSATPKLWINGSAVVGSAYAGFVLDSELFVPAKLCFSDSDLASYEYFEDNGLIRFTTEKATLEMVIDSPVAYQNGSPILLPAVPRLIRPSGAKKSEPYVPALFTADSLGFVASYDIETTTFSMFGSKLNEKDASLGGSITIGAEDALTGNYTADTSMYTRVMFSFLAKELMRETYESMSVAFSPAMVAYECANSDALYIKGVSCEDFTITDKGDEIEIVFEKHKNAFGLVSFFNADYRYLNYCYLRPGSVMQIKIIKTSDLQFYSYDVPEGCMIHFTDTAGQFADKLSFIKREEVKDYTEVLDQNKSNTLPAVVFDRSTFVIKLPDGISKNDVTEVDDYRNKTIRISIPGDCVSYLEKQAVYKNIPTLSGVSFTYNATTKRTSILLKTTKIQGYRIQVKEGFLGVTIADPKAIYDKIIVLDAGHGGIDPGTLRGSVLEKNVNFNVVNVYAPQYFQNSDIKVYYTRQDDTKISLSDRAAFAAQVDADMFISFHVNANNESVVSGTNVYYSASNNTATTSGLKSSLLASCMQKHMVKQWGTRDRGILTARFDVIHKNTVPAVLIECAFITNDKDFAKIKSTDYQKKAAKAIFDAVTEIYATY